MEDRVEGVDEPGRERGGVGSIVMERMGGDLPD